MLVPVEQNNTIVKARTLPFNVPCGEKSATRKTRKAAGILLPLLTLLEKNTEDQGVSSLVAHSISECGRIVA